MNNKKDSATAELLSEMYRNVTMGSENLTAVIPKIKDKFLLKNITAQLEKYAQYEKDTEALLNREAVKPKSTPAAKKLLSRSGIALSASINPNVSHIAEMISVGTHTGARQLENKMRELQKQGVADDVVTLCRSVVEFKRTESDKIKDYM